MEAKRALLVIKPMTDLPDLEMVTRKCKCGCNLEFKVLKSSKQKFRSYDCQKLMEPKERTHRWKQGMSYMIKG